MGWNLLEWDGIYKNRLCIVTTMQSAILPAPPADPLILDPIDYIFDQLDRIGMGWNGLESVKIGWDP